MMKLPDDLDYLRAIAPNPEWIARAERAIDAHQAELEFAYRAVLHAQATSLWPNASKDDEVMVMRWEPFCFINILAVIDDNPALDSGTDKFSAALARRMALILKEIRKGGDGPNRAEQG